LDFTVPIKSGTKALHLVASKPEVKVTDKIACNSSRGDAGSSPTLTGQKDIVKPKRLLFRALQ